jgi:hypothetical protein
MSRSRSRSRSRSSKRKSGSGCIDHVSLILTLVYLNGQIYASSSVSREQGARGTHGLGGWVEPKVSPDDMKKLIFLSLQGIEL